MAQFSDEQGKPFNSYEELCNAQPPYGLGSEPKEIEELISRLELTETKKVDIPEDPLKDLGNPSNYFHKFSKVVEACPDNQILNASKIGEILDFAVLCQKSAILKEKLQNLGKMKNSKIYFQHFLGPMVFHI